ncbi:MAG: VWA domain-containing protein [Blastocatellia bacterium]|nr:VWA domain-containing protein [Blastocatellia bacterium]
MPARLIFILVAIVVLGIPAAAQSGRVKPAESPTPQPQKRISLPGPIVDRPRIAEPTATPFPADDGEVITVDSTLVPIPVSVVDRSGRAVRTLNLNDFDLKIDGRTVEISDISRAQTPVRLAMLFDNSGSVLKAREFEIEAAIGFFRRVLRPDRDLAALYSVSTYTRLEQPFTRDVNLLVRTIRAMPPPTGATALLDGIEMAAEYLGEQTGRRVIVIVSDGDDTKTDTTFDAALRMAQNYNCQIYVVRTTEFENFIRTGSRVSNANSRLLTAERRMLEFARQTGGSVFSPIDRSELDEAFRAISAELAEQYILNYYPDDLSPARGEFRKIELSIKGRDDMTIRARNGYYVRR